MPDLVLVATAPWLRCRFLVAQGTFCCHSNQAGQHFLGRHVTAHEGHPWNELADSAANRFRAVPRIYTVEDGHAWSVAKDAGIGPLPGVAGTVVTCFFA